MSHKFFQYCIAAGVAAALFWLSIKYFLPIALPFLLGLALAAAAEPAVRLLTGRLHLPRKSACVIAVSLVFVLAGTILTLLLHLLMCQLGRLQRILPGLEEAATQGLALLRQWLQSLILRLPEHFQESVQHFLEPSNTGGTLVSQALEKLPGLLTQLAGSLSSGLFGLLTGIISGYMISIRLPRLRSRLGQTLPESWYTRHLPALQGIRRGLGGWLLAQCKLAAVAFILLLVGFLLLRVSNPLLLAGLITLVDAFPVLGVGTVLLPWSLISLLQQNPARCLGLLGIYLAIWLTRSILEPRLIGKSLGLDPLLTLIAIYAGWRLFGITGMLLAPILTMAGAHVRQSLRQ